MDDRQKLDDREQLAIYAELKPLIKKHWPTIRARLDARSKPAREASDALQEAFLRAGLVKPAPGYTAPGERRVAK